MVDPRSALSYYKVRKQIIVRRKIGMVLSTITSKGQITIPKVVRDSLRLHQGDKVEFFITEGKEALLRPVTKKVDDVFGRLHKPGSKPVSIKEMDTVIRQKMKKSFK
jgi:AbrB family looped-hinge helix DNA binding protein